jgi:hypothetical protein
MTDFMDPAPSLSDSGVGQWLPAPQLTCRVSKQRFGHHNAQEKSDDRYRMIDQE